MLFRSRRLDELEDEPNVDKIELHEEIHEIAIQGTSDTDEFDNPNLKSRVWTIKFKINRKVIMIEVNISYQYPLVPPQITIQNGKKLDNLNSLPLAIKEKDSYRYLEPALNHLSWNPGTKMWSIISFLVESIIYSV